MQAICFGCVVRFKNNIFSVNFPVCLETKAALCHKYWKLFLETATQEKYNSSN